MDEDEDGYVTDPALVRAAYSDAQKLVDMVTAAFLSPENEYAELADVKIRTMTDHALSAVFSLAECLAEAVTVELIRREDI